MATVEPTNEPGVQSPRAPAMPRAKLARISFPFGVWTTSGWNWRPIRPWSLARAAYGVDSLEAMVRNPGGGSRIESPWLIQTGAAAGRPASSGSSQAARMRGRAVLPPFGGRDPTAELVGHELDPVADAQDRDLPLPQPRVGLRGILVIDRCRTAGQDDPDRPAPLDLVPRRVVRQEHRIDVQLPDPSGDELGVLAAEVEHDDRLRIRRLVVQPLHRPVEGLLEVGLDLEVVRGQDAMPGIRRLAMHRPTARRHRVQSSRGLLRSIPMGTDQAFHAEIRDLDERPTVCARVTAPMGDLGELFNRLPVQVLEHIRSTGADPAGALFARYHSFGPDR